MNNPTYTLNKTFMTICGIPAISETYIDNICETDITLVKIGAFDDKCCIFSFTQDQYKNDFESILEKYEHLKEEGKNYAKEKLDSLVWNQNPQCGSYIHDSALDHVELKEILTDHPNHFISVKYNDDLYIITAIED